MYEHPYLTYRVIEFEQEQAGRLAERRRLAEEDGGRRLRRSAGLFARMLRALSPRRTVASRRLAAESSRLEDCPAGRDCAALAA